MEVVVLRGAFPKLALIALPCCGLIATQASAATATGTFAVSMTIQSSCVLTSSSGIAFGTTGVLSANTDTTGTLGVQCTTTTPYTVALDAGAGTGASTATRKLTASGSTIDYALYRDSARTLTWGNVQGTDTVGGTGNGSTQTLTVYGRVPSQATPAAGSYTDTVNVTITY
jgi:spore coat protein U-like protein